MKAGRPAAGMDEADKNRPRPFWPTARPGRRALSRQGRCRTPQKELQELAADGGGEAGAPVKRRRPWTSS
ncbi:MAG: hypothetical protein V8S34_00210 [Lawsonibacter sp.]